MVSFTQFTASVVLAFCATTSALPAEAVPRAAEERTMLGQLPADKIPLSVLNKINPNLRHVQIDVASLGNTTEAPPSQQALDFAKRAIGNDDRVLYDSTAYPYDAMGRLIWSNGVYCSASLVGRRIVAAARHCAPLDGQQVSLTFQPDFFNVERFPSSQVTTLVYLAPGQTGDCNVKEDWALFILAQPLGDQRGYLGARVIDPSTEQNKAIFTTFGYPGDLAGGARPYRMTGITVRQSNSCETGGPLITDADSAGGQSGSALFRDVNGIYTYGALSVGVFSGGNQISTIFSSGANFVNTIASARVNFP